MGTKVMPALGRIGTAERATLDELAVEARCAELKAVPPAQSAQLEKAIGKEYGVLERAHHLGISVDKLRQVKFA